MSEDSKLVPTLTQSSCNKAESGDCECDCGAVVACIPVYEAERAVIEAAEAALSDLRGHVTRHFELFGTSNPYYKFPLRDLLEAIEALQEARDE